VVERVKEKKKNREIEGWRMWERQEIF